MIGYGKSWARRLALNTLVLAAALLPFGGAVAQYATSTVVAPVAKQPAFIQNQQWLDLGNGPLDIQPIEGNGSIYSSSGTGTGSTSGTSTAVTLTAIPTIQPCVGCIIQGVTNLGLTAWSATPIVITAFNGGTSITLSTPLNISAGTALSWGAVCPAGTAANVPGTAPGAITALQLSSPLPLRGGVGGTFPLYTQARLCGYGSLQGGFTFLYFAIGAH